MKDLEKMSQTQSWFNPIVPKINEGHKKANPMKVMKP